MDRREMEYLIVIAQEKNLSKAAERLFISQPALSRFLQRLEQHVGMPLFERKRKQLIATNAGEIYLDSARKMLQLEQELDRMLKKLKDNPNGRLRVGITPSRGRMVLPMVLPVFRSQYPEYELIVMEEDVDTLEHALEAGTIDICFFAMAQEERLAQKRFRCDLIAQEEIVLCTPKVSHYELLAEDRPGRHRPWINLKYLENDCFLLLNQHMRLGQEARHILEEHAISPIIVELSNIDTALALVSRQYGVSFASCYRLNDHESAGKINIFTFGEHVISWDFVVAYKKDTTLTAPAKHLIQLMNDLY